MSNQIPLESRVTCPVTDADGEEAYRVGILKDLNKRYATVEIDGKNVKVGKTKIELFAPQPEEGDDRLSKGRDFSRYEKVRSHSGRKSLDNGDRVSQALRGKDLDYAYQWASGELKIKEEVLRALYGHLNPGQQRMCLGNKVRTYYKGLGS